MIILSNSIPKSGSTLLANYQQDMLSRSKVRSGQATLKSDYKVRFIKTPTKSILLNLFRINLLNGSIVVKCHWAFSKILNFYCRFLDVRMTMTYRDPRDMILSMIDHGNRTRNGKDPSGAFADCNNIIDLIPLTVKLMEQLQTWQSKEYIHCIKYEDLMTDQFNVLKEMNTLFRWNLGDDSLREIIELREKSKNTSHNFNKGTTERWKKEMNEVEKSACLEAFKPYLNRLNYSPT